jgi:hypothetical protein
MLNKKENTWNLIKHWVLTVIEILQRICDLHSVELNTCNNCARSPRHMNDVEIMTNDHPHVKLSFGQCFAMKSLEIFQA